jgi:hypothetical protein
VAAEDNNKAIVCKEGGCGFGRCAKAVIAEKTCVSDDFER